MQHFPYCRSPKGIWLMWMLRLTTVLKDFRDEPPQHNRNDFRKRVAIFRRGPGAGRCQGSDVILP